MCVSCFSVVHSKYVLDMKLAGLFVFDTSMDTMNPNTGEWTYELINSIAAQIGGHGPCHAISSSVTDDWCNMNCHHQPEICPIDLCACSDIAPPAGSCHSISGSVTDAWCQENCHHGETEIRNFCSFLDNFSSNLQCPRSVPLTFASASTAPPSLEVVTDRH